MDPETPQWLIILAGISGVLGGATGIAAAFNAWLNRRKPAAEIRKSDAETEEIKAKEADLVSQAALRVVDKWEAQVNRLDQKVEAQGKKIDEQGEIIQRQSDKLDEQARIIQAQTVEMEGLRSEVRELTDGIERLIAQVVARNEEPVYRPPRKKQTQGGQSAA